MEREYTTGLCKGQGMLPETLRILRACAPGTTAAELSAKVRTEGLLPKATAQRVSDIVNRVFVPRYMRTDGQPAGWLRTLLQRNHPLDQLNQLLFLYTAREHLILYDFVREVYWPKYAAGAASVFREDSVNFIKASQASGLIKTKWTEGNNVRIGRYLLSALHDFGLLGAPQGGRRAILPFRPHPSTVIFLAHELHFSGVGDWQLPAHTDWQLYGLTPSDTLGELRRVAQQGRFIVQSGDFIRISWGFNSMADSLDAIAE